jgi:enoyl-CoA hydratase
MVIPTPGDGNGMALSLTDVRQFTLEPNWADDEPNAGFLLVDLTTDKALPAEDKLAIAAWLTDQPLPVVGMGKPVAVGQASARLVDALDVHVTTDQDRELVVDAICKNPVASAVLIQVLRSVSLLPVALGLAVESLAYATLQGGEEFSRWLAARPEKATRDHPPRSPVLLDRRDDRLTITLDSPENRNALSVVMRDALAEAFKLVAMDSSITAVDVFGNGPCFSAGGDLTEFGSSTDDIARAHLIRSLRMPAQYLAPHADRYTFQLHGACIGAGIELPAFAARIIAKPDAVFRLPEVAMGLIPGAGGCNSITGRIGRHRTAYMAITGREVPAAEALDWGLIDEIS